MSTPDAITLDELTKRFGNNTAVDNVSLSVPTGTVYGLVGPNGAGKTTLMRTMLGFTRASTGSAKLLGFEMPKQKQEVYLRVGVIIEEPRFFPFLTGRENLMQIVSVRKKYRAIPTQKVDDMLAMVGLYDRANEKVKTYSLGMRQRLGIARALLHDPDLLLLDEPSNGLDPPGIRDMRSLLKNIAAQGRTVLVSSHLLAEMELMCDYVAVLKQGKLVSSGPIKELVGGIERQILFGVTDLEKARNCLSQNDLVHKVKDASQTGCLIVVLKGNAPDDASATLNEVLLSNGVRVGRIERASKTLEQTFMEIVQ